MLPISAANSQRIADALAMCISAFAGKFHRDGMPACMHSIMVAMDQETPEAIELALLHDVPEDCGEIWFKKIRERFGDLTYYRVQVITRRDKETYPEYSQRISDSGDVIIIRVKISDLRHNMSPMRSDEKSRQKAVAYGNSHDMLVRRFHDLCSAPSASSTI